MKNKIGLSDIPDIQKEWFIKDWDVLRKLSNKDKYLKYKIFKYTVLGTKKNDEEIKTAFILSFKNNTFKSMIIRDVLHSCLCDCLDFEYFEMAENIEYIFDLIDPLIDFDNLSFKNIQQ